MKYYFKAMRLLFSMFVLLMFKKYAGVGHQICNPQLEGREPRRPVGNKGAGLRTMGKRKRVELRKWAFGEHNYYQEHTRCENKRPPAVYVDRVQPRGRLQASPPWIW